MKTLFTFLSLLFIIGLGYGQTTIAVQDFDSGTPTWNYTAYPTPYSTGSDDWDILATNSDPSGTTGLFWAMQDLNNGNGGGNFEHTLTFDGINISGYSSVTVSFKYYTKGFDSGDYLKYEVFQGNTGSEVSQGQISLNKNTNAWTDVSIIIPDAENSVYIKLIAYQNGGSDYAGVDNYKITGTLASSNSNESIITKKSGWSEPTNIAYTTYNAASGLTTGNSIEVASFTIQDGDGSTADADAVSTILTDISVDIDNWNNIKAFAIFDGTTNVGEVTSMAATVDFSSLTLTAADDATKDFTLRATFNTAVTDNQNIKYTISDATADGTNGSIFATADAGGAATDNTGDNNKIEVTADRLAFTSNKPPASVTNASNFEVEVEATDANNNRDLDATNSITLAKASGTGALSSVTGLTQSLSAGVYSWTDVQYDTDEDFTIEAQNGSLTNTTSGTITCSTVAPIPDLIISEVADPKDNYKARFVELYNGSGSTIDFSTETFYLCRQSNGGSWGDIQLAGTVAAEDMYVIANNTSDHNSAYGSNPDQANGYISGNGDDGYFLYYGGNHTTGTLVDQYGLIDEDGTGKNWEYTDSRVVRNTSEQKSGSKAAHAFDIADWTITDPANAADMTPGTKDGGQTLPINLLSFTTTIYNNSVVLLWQTATEENNDYFTIERSYNTKDFEEVVQVAGAGNSNQVLNYKYNDANADLTQTIYYKLKQTDYDGKYTYSSIISVNSKSNAFEIIESYANNGIMNISINSNINNSASIELYDIAGSLVYNNKLLLKKGINSYKINVSEYSSGVYFIRVNDNNQTINKKLIIR